MGNVRETLRVGDVVQANIITQGEHPTLLVRKGTVVTEKLLDSLCKFNYDFSKMKITIKRGDQVVNLGEPKAPEPEIDKPKEETAQTLTMSDRIKQDAVQAARSLFSAGADVAELHEEVKETSNDIAKSILEVGPNATVCIQDLRVADEYTYQHSVDVSILSAMLARKLGLSEGSVREIAEAGILHDLGKRRVPLEILNKPGKLTDDEFAVMKQHPVFGYNDIQSISGISEAIKIGVLEHHEKVNGKGYPMGLAGNKISTYGKIISIVDVYDALTSKRPYKTAMSSARAVGIMTEMLDSFDKVFFATFLQCITLYPVGSYVLCTDGKSYKVIQHNALSPVKPILLDETAGQIYDLSNADCNLKIFGEDCDEIRDKLKKSK